MWGVLDNSVGRYPLKKLPQILDKLKSLGYNGIEMPIAFVMEYGSKEFETLMVEKQMQLIAQVFSTGPPPIPGNMGLTSSFGIEHPKDPENGHDVIAHQKIWAGQVLEAAQLKASGVLRSVTSHTGRDYFTEAEADAMFSFCTAFEKEHNMIVNHETHRARILYSPWVVERILKVHPDLHLCADLSHYSCVAESGPTEPEINKVVTLLAPRVRHIHARVGFEEGPQIPDPRGDIWKPYHEGYMVWWEKIYTHAKNRNDDSFSTTPEFGPPMYAWTNPYDGNKPIVNVWDVNHWVGQQVTEMFGNKIDKSGAGKLENDPHKGIWEL